MEFEHLSRRKVLKTMADGTAIAGIVGVGSARPDEEKNIDPRAEPPYDFEYKTVGEDIRDAVGHLWWLLTVDRNRIDELLAKSPAGKKEVLQKKETVTKLRSIYETELEQDEQNENELTYHLTEPVLTPLEESEIGKETANSVAKSIGKALRQEFDPKVRTMHSSWIHERMAVGAIRDTKLDNKKIRDELKEGATDPDEWDQKCKVCSDDWFYLTDPTGNLSFSPDKIEEELRKEIRDINDSASPHHMYVPGNETISPPPLVVAILPPYPVKIEIEGAAPDDAQEHYNRGKGTPTDFVQIGRAFHFMQDMSHPLHTGAIGPQVLNTQGTIHNAYKRFVQDNWDNADDTSDDLIEHFERGTDNPQWDGSVKKACENIAKGSANYSEDIYETIVEEGPNNRDDWDEIVEDSAYAGMWYIGAYSRGVIRHDRVQFVCLLKLVKKPTHEALAHSYSRNKFIKSVSKNTV